MFEDVLECIDCHEEHLEIWFDELAVPLELDDKVYYYRYKCPTTGNNVYMERKD